MKMGEMERKLKMVWAGRKKLKEDMVIGGMKKNILKVA